MLHLGVFFLKSAPVKTVNSNGYSGLEPPHIQQTILFLPDSHIFFDLQLLFNVRCYTSVLTQLNFRACGYCCSQSTDSWLEALPWSRRKGRCWNSFPTTGPVCRGRCIFSHTPCVPLQSEGSRRSRQVYLHGETEKKRSYTPDKREGSREGEIKVRWNKPCSLQGSGSQSGWFFFLWPVNASFEKKTYKPLRKSAF